MKRNVQILSRAIGHIFREYISQIEMYPEPEIDLGSLKRGNVYRDYIDWYLSVLNEA